MKNEENLKKKNLDKITFQTFLINEVKDYMENWVVNAMMITNRLYMDHLKIINSFDLEWKDINNLVLKTIFDNTKTE